MRKLLQGLTLGAVLLLLSTTVLFAQYAERQDVIWARNTNGASITLDGVLDEAVWAQAESVMVVYGVDGPLPTSASRPEFQPEALKDPTNATVKFLVNGNMLYVGFFMPDSSVGGTQDWARWDGLLMSLKDHGVNDRPAPPRERFFTWWYANVDSLIAPGVPPMFRGYEEDVNDTARTAAQKARWDGAAHVEGISNDDAQPDEYWSAELQFNLDSLGYDVNKPGGEIVEFNFSIWDQDWVWSGDPLRVTSTRTWWQSPWNANADNVGRVMVRSDVTVSSGPVPTVQPDVVVRNGSTVAEPIIDGVLDDEGWMYADSFHVRWNDQALRDTYPTVGPWRSGQFQPDVGTGAPIVTDSASATIKMFFRNEFLYLAADVDDRYVQGTNTFDRIDGVRFIIGDRDAVDGDNRMLFRQLLAVFDSTGAAAAWDYLPVMVDSSNTEFAIVPKGNSTVNNNLDIDEGFAVEMKVDLTYLGYPQDLGDHLLFMGVMVGDGDSFLNSANDYGTRTWWFREHNGGPAAAWMVMDPNSYVGIEKKTVANIPKTVELFGNYPNPFNPATTLKYSIPFAGNVSLQVYNVLGQKVAALNAGSKSAGSHTLKFNGNDLSSGIYLYRVEVKNIATGKVLQSKVSKMALIK